MRKFALIFAILSLVVPAAAAGGFSDGGDAPAPTPVEDGGGGGGYPLYCREGISVTIFINGPMGWRWRQCSFGLAYVAPGQYTNEYGWIDGCAYPNGPINCWRWRPL